MKQEGVLENKGKSEDVRLTEQLDAFLCEEEQLQSRGLSRGNIRGALDP